MTLVNKEMKVLIRIIILVTTAATVAVSANIDCGGKSFHCVNSTHFMICVDFGGGVSSTLGNYLIPCPPSTECRKSNKFECEFPKQAPPSVDVSVNSKVELIETTTSRDTGPVKLFLTTESASALDALNATSGLGVTENPQITTPVNPNITGTTSDVQFSLDFMTVSTIQDHVTEKSLLSTASDHDAYDANNISNSSIDLILPKIDKKTSIENKNTNISAEEALTYYITSTNLNQTTESAVPIKANESDTSDSSPLNISASSATINNEIVTFSNGTLVSNLGVIDNNKTINNNTNDDLSKTNNDLGSYVNEYMNFTKSFFLNISIDGSSITNNNISNYNHVSLENTTNNFTQNEKFGIIIERQDQVTEVIIAVQNSDSNTSESYVKNNTSKYNDVSYNDSIGSSNLPVNNYNYSVEPIGKGDPITTIEQSNASQLLQSNYKEKSGVYNTSLLSETNVRTIAQREAKDTSDTQNLIIGKETLPKITLSSTNNVSKETTTGDVSKVTNTYPNKTHTPDTNSTIGHSLNLNIDQIASGYSNNTGIQLSNGNNMRLETSTIVSNNYTKATSDSELSFKNNIVKENNLNYEEIVGPNNNTNNNDYILNTTELKTNSNISSNKNITDVEIPTAGIKKDASAMFREISSFTSNDNEANVSNTEQIIRVHDNVTVTITDLVLELTSKDLVYDRREISNQTLYLSNNTNLQNHTSNEQGNNLNNNTNTKTVNNIELIPTITDILPLKNNTSDTNVISKLTLPTIDGAYSNNKLNTKEITNSNNNVTNDIISNYTNTNDLVLETASKGLENNTRVKFNQKFSRETNVMPSNHIEQVVDLNNNTNIVTLNNTEIPPILSILSKKNNATDKSVINDQTLSIIDGTMIMNKSYNEKIPGSGSNMDTKYIFLNNTEKQKITEKPNATDLVLDESTKGVKHDTKEISGISSGTMNVSLNDGANTKNVPLDNTGTPNIGIVSETNSTGAVLETNTEGIINDRSMTSKPMSSQNRKPNQLKVEEIPVVGNSTLSTQNNNTALEISNKFFINSVDTIVEINSSIPLDKLDSSKPLNLKLNQTNIVRESDLVQNGSVSKNDTKNEEILSYINFSSTNNVIGNILETTNIMPNQLLSVDSNVTTKKIKNSEEMVKNSNGITNNLTVNNTRTLINKDILPQSSDANKIALETTAGIETEGIKNVISALPSLKNNVNTDNTSKLELITSLYDNEKAKGTLNNTQSVIVISSLITNTSELVFETRTERIPQESNVVCNQTICGNNSNNTSIKLITSTDNNMATNIKGIENTETAISSQKSNLPITNANDILLETTTPNVINASSVISNQLHSLNTSTYIAHKSNITKIGSLNNNATGMDINLNISESLKNGDILPQKPNAATPEISTDIYSHNVNVYYIGNNTNIEQIAKVNNNNKITKTQQNIAVALPLNNEFTTEGIKNDSKINQELFLNTYTNITNVLNINQIVNTNVNRNEISETINNTETFTDNVVSSPNNSTSYKVRKTMNVGATNITEQTKTINNNAYTNIITSNNIELHTNISDATLISNATDIVFETTTESIKSVINVSENIELTTSINGTHNKILNKTVPHSHTEIPSAIGNETVLKLETPTKHFNKVADEMENSNNTFDNSTGVINTGKGTPNNIDSVTNTTISSSTNMKTEILPEIVFIETNSSPKATFSNENDMTNIKTNHNNLLNNVTHIFNSTAKLRNFYNNRTNVKGAVTNSGTIFHTTTVMSDVKGLPTTMIETNNLNARVENSVLNISQIFTNNTENSSLFETGQSVTVPIVLTIEDSVTLSINTNYTNQNNTTKAIPTVWETAGKLEYGRSESLGFPNTQISNLTNFKNNEETVEEILPTIISQTNLRESYDQKIFNGVNSALENIANTSISEHHFNLPINVINESVTENVMYHIAKTTQKFNDSNGKETYTIKEVNFLLPAFDEKQNITLVDTSNRRKGINFNNDASAASHKLLNNISSLISTTHLTRQGEEPLIGNNDTIIKNIYDFINNKNITVNPIDITIYDQVKIVGKDIQTVKSIDFNPITPTINNTIYKSNLFATTISSQSTVNENQYVDDSNSTYTTPTLSIQSLNEKQPTLVHNISFIDPFIRNSSHNVVTPNKKVQLNTSKQENFQTSDTQHLRESTDSSQNIKDNKTKTNEQKVHNVQNRTYYNPNEFKLVPSSITAITKGNVSDNMIKINVHTLSESNKNLSQSMGRSFNCFNRKRGRYSDKQDCSLYYICIGRLEPVIGKCPVNTVFSEITKQCTKNNTHCALGGEFKCTLEGRFSDPINENSYFICVANGKSYVRFKFQCQNGYYLDRILVKCIRESGFEYQKLLISKDDSKSESSINDDLDDENTDLEYSSSGDVKHFQTGFTCVKEGKFGDNNDCRKYYECTITKNSEFRRRIKKCDKDEVFHKDKKKCVDDDDYDC